MMKHKIFLFFFFSFLVIHTQGGCFPDDLVSSLDEQMELYCKAYQRFKNPEDIDVKLTPVPALVPLIRMGYSYTKDLLGKDLQRLELLSQFWQETEQEIQANKLTLQYFKFTNFRLAMLVSDGQEKSRYFMTSGLKEFHASGDWKNLNKYEEDKYSELHVKPFPFCFEAILYYREGEFLLETYHDAYFRDNFTLVPCAFSQSGKGPHGNWVADSASLLFHDFEHWDVFIGDLNTNVQAWNLARSLLKTCWRSEVPPSRFNEVGVFLLSHEFEPQESFFRNDFQPSEENSFIQEKMPFSPREMFRRWVNGAIEIVKDFKYPESTVFSKVPEDRYFPLKESGLVWDVLKSTPLGDDIFEFDVLLFLGDTPSTAKKITAKAYGQFFPTEDPYWEKVMIQKLTDIQLNKHDQNSNKSIDIHQIQQELTALSNFSCVCESRYSVYEFDLFDLGKLMRTAYGESTLLPLVSSEEIIDKLLKFLSEFYEKYKTLFSDKEIRS